MKILEYDQSKIGPILNGNKSALKKNAVKALLIQNIIL